jgi:mannose-6-phosphate isomerase-like protein (cupin superfamily)
MKNIYEVNDVLSELDKHGGYFIDFITTRHIQAGILLLHAGDNDTQDPHSVDEVYYVIQGNGLINLDGKNYAIKQGTSIFVAAGTEHRFHGNAEDLVVFYVLGSSSNGS